ncbi:hypothetical protein C8R44DRAFT_731370 [Mycena epipterygia]|nr:hypothetical protein C8R44DRAFT_731370 [Mycena epipterygia]
MPHQPTATEVRMNSVLAILTPMVTLLNEMTDAFGTPFMRAISSTTLSLMALVQNVKRNKEECIQLMENIHSILYAIIDLHIISKTRGSLAPAILDHIGNFTETLHKIHMFVETQQDGKKIKYFFRQTEMNTLRKDCQAGLEKALKFFKVETGLIIANKVVEMQQKTQSMHQELLELVGNLSDGVTSDRSSSPKIFHGREQQLEKTVASLTQQSAHIAILGAGGIGKTSLARAALHHPDVAGKYEHRFFVAADSATTSIELAALTGSHLGLKPGKDLTKAVVQFISTGPPCLLVLDNLETPWEPLESRGGVEEFLSLLTDIPHLALIITMRGAERPAKTFIEIADDSHDPRDINQLLQLTGNMPLAVDLIAHLVDYEGCSNVLARWKTEKTSLLSTGYDKQSSLDASIILSLGSPRMTPGAKDLLSLLSILPDGLSDAELLQSQLPIQDLLGCRATLLRTSLAYFDDKQRLKSLVPIREHTHTFSPPTQPLFHPLCKYFQSVMDLYRRYNAAQLKDAVSQITPNLSNLHQLLLLELHSDNLDIADAINCTISLSAFLRITGQGRTALMDNVPAVFPQPCDHQIEAKYVIEMLKTIPIVDPQAQINRGIAHFYHLNDPVLEAQFYSAAGYYRWYYEHDLVTSRQWFQKALSLAKLSGDSKQHSLALEHLAQLKSSMGEYYVAQMHAHEAQEIAQLSGNLYHEASALRNEAGCLISLGNLKESVFLCQRSRELLQLCGMQGGQVDHSAMIMMAEINKQKSEYLEAYSINIEIAQNASAQDPFYNAGALMNIAELDVMIGVDTVKVQCNLDIAKAIYRTLGLAREVTHCETILADLYLREGEEMVAKTLFQQCLNYVWGNDNEAISYCLERLADIGRWTSTKDDLLSRWPAIYLGHAQKTEEKMAVYKALRFLGDVFLSEGDAYTAHNLFVVALDGFTYMDIHRSRGDCMLRLGDIAKHRGDLVKAAELWTDARPLFECSLQTKEIANIDTRLALIEQEISDAHQKSLALLNLLEAPTMSVDEPSIASNTNATVI